MVFWVVVIIIVMTVLPMLLRVATDSLVDRFINWLGGWLAPPAPELHW